MTIDKCLITLKPLTNQKDQATGYSRSGLISLVGSAKVSLQLPFTRQEFITTQPIHQKGMSISGYQPKLSLSIKNNALALVENSGDYILKPSPEEYPHLAENEHAIMLVMKHLGFDIPSFGLVSFLKINRQDKAEYAFLIKRYDRASKNETSFKIHQEQLDGAMNIADKYGKINNVSTVSYEQVGQFMISNVDSSLSFKKDFFLRIMYAYLLGNNDLHLRNFGILVPEIDKNTLAPVYDYVSTIPYFEGDALALPLLAIEENEFTLAPGFNTAFGSYTGYDFLLFGIAIGLNKKMALKLILSATGKRNNLVSETIKNSYMQEDHKEKVISCFNFRIKALQQTSNIPL